MLNFLAVFDGYKMSRSTVDYSLELAKSSKVHLTGVFLDEFIYHSYSVYNVLTTQKSNSEEVLKTLDEKDKMKREEAVRSFQKACVSANINYSIHRDKNIAIQELKYESMFADLIIISQYETFTRFKEKAPSQFMKDLLGDVQCPVLVVPDHFKAIDKIVLLYDGTSSSLHSIKMFCYLLNDLKNLPVDIFTVRDHYMAPLRLPSNKLMREFVKRHFLNATFTIEKGIPEEEITGYLRNHKENQLVVLGVYERNELSRYFKTSMADILIKEINPPLFIAHTK